MALCSICTTPGARAIVEELLAKGVSLKTIARQTGLAKSSIHRHSQTCILRRAATELKSVRFDPAHDRVLTDLGGGRFFVQRDPQKPETAHTTVTELRAGDWLITPEYETPAPPREPA